MACFLFLCGAAALGKGQSEWGEVLRIPHHQRILRFFKGGDGYYYLFMSSSGSTGRFSRNGESNFSLRRFNPQLEFDQELKFRRTNRRAGWPENAYAAIPTGRGLAIFSLESTSFGKAAELCAYHLQFPNGSPAFVRQRIVAMPDHLPGLSDPQVRLFRHPDADPPMRGRPGRRWSITWRQLRDVYDNSLGTILVQDQGADTLIVKSRLEMPFKKMLVPVVINEIQALAEPALAFRIEAHDPNTLSLSRSSKGSAFLWHIPNDTALLFRLSNQKMIPLSFETGIYPRKGDPSWDIRLTGLYSAYLNDSLSMGIYQGDYTYEDTLAQLELEPLDSHFSAFLVQKFREKSQLISYRRVQLDKLHFQGYATHFVGCPALPAMEELPQPTSRHTVCKSLFRLPGTHSERARWSYFYQSRYEEYGEVSGLAFLPQRGLFLYNSVLPQASNRELRTPRLYQLSMDPEATPQEIILPSLPDKNPTIPAPRFHAEGNRPHERVLVARYRTRLRLLRLQLD